MAAFLISHPLGHRRVESNTGIIQVFPELVIYETREPIIFESE